MALVKCPKCGKEISDRASSCIHCGCPLAHLTSVFSEETTSKASFPIKGGISMKRFALFSLCLVLCVALVGCGASEEIIISSSDFVHTKDEKNIVEDSKQENSESDENLEDDDTKDLGIEDYTGISVEESYSDMISGSDFLHFTLSNGVFNYKFKDYAIASSSVVKVGGEYVVNQGAMYDEIAAGLWLCCDLGKSPEQLNDEMFLTVLIGTDEQPENWSELADDLYTFINSDATEKEIIARLETLEGTTGTFDYEARKYEFTIFNVNTAAGELGISREMLGYVLAKLNEYPSTITFDGDSLTCSLNVKTYG